MNRWKGGPGWGGNNSPFQMWPYAKLGRTRAVIQGGGMEEGYGVGGWVGLHWVEKGRFVMCTWQWRRGHRMIERLALGAMWQHNKDSEAAYHRLEKQTLGSEVGRQMGQEPGPGEDSHMWEAADVWSIMPSSHPLYTLLCVRAPWPPQSHIDKHYPNLLIYSFSLVRVGRRRGRSVSLPVTLALPLEWITMFYIVLCFKVIFYFRASLTSGFSWTDAQVFRPTFLCPSISLIVIHTEHFWGTLHLLPFVKCPCDSSLLKTASLRPTGQTFILLLSILILYLIAFKRTLWKIVYLYFVGPYVSNGHTPFKESLLKAKGIFVLKTKQQPGILYIQYYSGGTWRQRDLKNTYVGVDFMFLCLRFTNSHSLSEARCQGDV